MKRKYLLKSQIKTAQLSRLLAKGIDLFIALIITIFIYPIGVFLAVGYLAYSDHMQNGQSVGKRFIGFRVVSLEDGSPCSFRQSIIRNLPIIIPLSLSIIPVLGWVFTALLIVPICLLEAYLIFKLDSGHRLGDVMADTTVIANDPHAATEEEKKESWFKVEGSQSPS